MLWTGSSNMVELFHGSTLFHRRCIISNWTESPCPSAKFTVLLEYLLWPLKAVIKATLFLTIRVQKGGSLNWPIVFMHISSSYTGVKEKQQHIASAIKLFMIARPKSFNTPSKHHTHNFPHIIHLQYYTTACVSRSTHFISDICAGWWWACKEDLWSILTILTV